MLAAGKLLLELVRVMNGILIIKGRATVSADTALKPGRVVRK